MLVFTFMIELLGVRMKSSARSDAQPLQSRMAALLCPALMLVFTFMTPPLEKGPAGKDSAPSGDP
jgi:hypothetical protein